MVQFSTNITFATLLVKRFCLFALFPLFVYCMNLPARIHYQIITVYTINTQKFNS